MINPISSFPALLTTLLILLCAASDSVTAQKTVALQSSTSWCMFLPPAPNDTIANFETTANAFCTSQAPSSASDDDAKTFPVGLIRSATYLKGTGYVQVTGSLNSSAYFNATDDGGQFDSAGAPVGGVCTGYKYFINIIEPANNRYCIRCCTTQTRNATVQGSCLFDHSKYGCAFVVPNGNYTGQIIPASAASSSLPPSTPGLTVIPITSTSVQPVATSPANSTSSLPYAASAFSTFPSSSSSSITNPVLTALVVTAIFHLLGLVAVHA